MTATDASRTSARYVTGSSSLYDDGVTKRRGVNRPQTSRDHVADLAFFAAAKATQLFAADRGLDKVFVVGPRRTSRIPDRLFVKSELAPNERGWVFEYPRPGVRTDMRDLPVEEIPPHRNFPKPPDGEMLHPQGALHDAVVQHYGITLEEVGMVEIPEWHLRKRPHAQKSKAASPALAAAPPKRREVVPVELAVLEGGAANGNGAHVNGSGVGADMPIAVPPGVAAAL